MDGFTKIGVGGWYITVVEQRSCITSLWPSQERGVRRLVIRVCPSLRFTGTSTCALALSTPSVSAIFLLPPLLLRHPFPSGWVMQSIYISSHPTQTVRSPNSLHSLLSHPLPANSQNQPFTSPTTLNPLPHPRERASHRSCIAGQVPVSRSKKLESRQHEKIFCKPLPVDLSHRETVVVYYLYHIQSPSTDPNPHAYFPSSRRPLRGATLPGSFRQRFQYAQRPNASRASSSTKRVDGFQHRARRQRPFGDVFLPPGGWFGPILHTAFEQRGPRFQTRCSPRKQQVQALHLSRLGASTPHPPVHVRRCLLLRKSAYALSLVPC